MFDDGTTKRRCSDCGKPFRDYKGNKLPCPECSVKYHIQEMATEIREDLELSWSRRFEDILALVDEVISLRAKLKKARKRK